MELTTERLVLYELSGNDLGDIHQLHSLKETDEFNTLGLPNSIQMTENLLNEWIPTAEGYSKGSLLLLVSNSKKQVNLSA